jgi:hypothetical protein
MAKRRIKFSKIAVVVFLTALIWIWAELALDDEQSFSGATITIGKSRSNLWISFRGEPTVDINEVVLKGPVSKISEVKQIIGNNPDKLKFNLDAEQHGFVSPGEHPLRVREFLRESIWIRELGLTVESCEPEIVDVNIVELVQKELTVRCIDGDANPRRPESIEPGKIQMFVPRSWGGERLVASVTLTRGDIEKARSEEIVKTPYIVLAPGQPPRRAATNVRIKMPPEGDLLQQYTVKNPKLGYCFSYNLQGKYKVEVDNLIYVLDIPIRATLAAIQAYEENTQYHVILDIIDSDEFKDGGNQRVVRYNFPREFVEKGEIFLDKEPVEAVFRLERISSGSS